MWVVRELLRLAARIGIAVVIAVVIGELRILISGGNALHAFRVVCVLIGGLYLLLAAGPAMTLDGRVGSMRFWTGFEDLRAAPGPTLTANTVFVVSGVALVAVAVFA